MGTGRRRAGTDADGTAGPGARAGEVTMHGAIPRRSRLVVCLAVMIFFAPAWIAASRAAAPAAPKNLSQAGEDDWRFEEEYAKVHAAMESSGRTGAMAPPATPLPSATTKALRTPGGTGRIGLSTGGAKDIGNFRENIAKGFLPLPTDVTYEGVFYDYYFDVSGTCQANQLFCPSYTTAVSKDPFSGKPEYFLSVGLGSSLDAASFQRKKLNIMVVLDISGSMSASFDAYYYDRFGNKREETAQDPDRSKPKVEVAAEAVIALLDQLKPDDRFGLVLFDQFASFLSG